MKIYERIVVFIPESGVVLTLHNEGRSPTTRLVSE